MESLQVLKQSNVEFESHRTGWQALQQLARATSEINGWPVEPAGEIGQVSCLHHPPQQRRTAADLFSGIDCVEV